MKRMLEVKINLIENSTMKDILDVKNHFKPLKILNYVIFKNLIYSKNNLSQFKNYRMKDKVQTRLKK